jgi:hypothetical protein
MAKKKVQEVRFHFVVSKDLAAATDAKARALVAQTPGATITRSDVARMALAAFVGVKS